MKKFILIALLVLLICLACNDSNYMNKDVIKKSINIQENSGSNIIIEERTTENIDETTFFLDIPKELYGKWKITEYRAGRFVEHSGAPEILNDTFELNENYIIYNEEKFINPCIKYHYYNLSSAEIQKMRYQPYNLGMCSEETADICYIVGDDTGKEKGWTIELFYTSNRELFVFVGSGRAGKAKKIE